MKNLKTLVKSTNQTTEFIVGSNILNKLGEIISDGKKNYSSFLVLSDKNIFKLYGGKIVSSLQKLNKHITRVVIPAGEKYKSLQEIENIIKVYFKGGVTKSSCLIALGGGVITDMGGFIASILLRGLDTIYLPTTLLGQVDAAIGGKTGVDFQISPNILLKNMIGTIRQPNIVVSDIDTLSTLPVVEILNGLGEMAKYWVGWAKPGINQLNFIRSSLASTPGVEREKLINIILLCQQIKTDIIQKDPEEKLGLRHKLNLGHTVGHAIEAVANGKLSHGQAVAIGLAATAKISLLMNLCSKNTYIKILSVLESLNLPTNFHVTMYRYMVTKKVALQEIKHAMLLDKKGGSFALIQDIGNLITGVNVPENIINQVLEEIICQRF